jgi:hypothetical protein
MAQYRKLLVAILGLAVLFLQRHYGVDFGGYEDQVAEVLISAVTAYSVYRAPNASVSA